MASETDEYEGLIGLTPLQKEVSAMREFVLIEADQQFNGYIFGTLRRYLQNWLKRQMLEQVYRLDEHLLDHLGLSQEAIGEALQLPLVYDPIAELYRRARAGARRLKR